MGGELKTHEGMDISNSNVWFCVSQVGKQKLASKQYNSPMAMYSEDVLEEIMQQVKNTESTNLSHGITY